MEVALPSHLPNEPAIHRLVNDILAYIFSLNATIPDYATTVASSQVCTRWRSIALNYRSIWGRIIDYHRHSLKRIETLLDRSYPTLLDFGSRINGVEFASNRLAKGVLKLVFNHTDRLRIFNLLDVSALSSASNWKLVRSRFLQLPAPNLEFVHIDIEDTIVDLTHPLFDNHAPKLQNLILTQVSMVNFISPVFTSLTELYVHNHENYSPTVLGWMDILRGMPSLRWVTIQGIRAISNAPANDIFPVVHLHALDMLSVDGPFHESVTLVDHLIVPPRCGLRFIGYDVHTGFDQRRLWAVIQKRVDSWPKNAPNRHLDVASHYNTLHDGFQIAIENLSEPGSEWEPEAVEVANGQCFSGNGVDPVISLSLHLTDNQKPLELFFSLFALFERTFFDTTYLGMSIDPGDDDILPLIDHFEGFENLEELSLVYLTPTDFPFPQLQQASSVLFPALKTIEFLFEPEFFNGSESFLPVTNFLQWRREQGFPIQKFVINSTEDSFVIDREYLLARIQDTVLEFDD